MKAIVLYSSRTGNTQKVAAAIRQGLPADTPCLPVSEAPASLAAYDCVFLGYWVDRGLPDAAAKAVLATLTNTHVALFGTLGANPDSEHGQMCVEHGNELVPNICHLAGSFLCQGAVDPKVIEMMYKQFPMGHPHGKSAARDALHAEAAKHPDGDDLARATQFAATIWRQIQE